MEDHLKKALSSYLKFSFLKMQINLIRPKIPKAPTPKSSSVHDHSPPGRGMIYSHPEVILVLNLVDSDNGFLVSTPVIQGSIEHVEAEGELGREGSTWKVV